MPRSPIEMDSVGALETKIAPAIGADTDTVLTALGYSNEAIKIMRQNGAIK